MGAMQATAMLGAVALAWWLVRDGKPHRTPRT
jgi:hypothetical protein